MVGEAMKVVHINLTGTAVIEEPLTACIGYFDGLHLGHQKLIEEVKRVAARRNTRCALITFDPDPWCVIRGLQDIAHITPMKQRMRIAEAMGIEYWIILDFSREMADLTPQDFHEKVLKRCVWIRWFADMISTMEEKGRAMHNPYMNRRISMCMSSIRSAVSIGKSAPRVSKS